MSEFSSGVKIMREFVAAVAGARGWGETRESWLAKAARKAGVSYRAVKAIWYGENKDENSKSARLLRDAAQKEAIELANRFETLARSIHAVDADFNCETIAALISVARQLRGQDRAGNSGE